jgi:glycosyltransferase involved in cell wall biosynthesis
VTRIAVAVPARNAAWCIDRCLGGLVAAGFAPDAVTVVDDGSRDDTAARARAAGVRVLPGDGRGAAAARNRAVAGSTADVLLFVDADVVVHPDLRTRLEAFLREHPEVDAVFGAYDDAPACTGVVGRYRNLLHHFVHTQGPRRPRSFWTGCGAVRRGAFERLGGLDPRQRMMEDVEFGLRLTAAGGIVALEPALQGKHLKCWSLPDMVRTDLLDRAVPWSRLMLAQGGLSGELNLSAAHRASAILSAFAVLGLLGAPVAPAAQVLAATVLAALVAINAAFFRLLLQRGGWRTALAGLPLHIVHYVCAMAGLGWVVLFEWFPQRIRARLSRDGAGGHRAIEEP